MLRLDEERAVAAIPALLAGASEADLSMSRDLVHRVAAIDGEAAGEVKLRLARVDAMFSAVAAGEAATPWKVASAEGSSRGRRRARSEGEPPLQGQRRGEGVRGA